MKTLWDGLLRRKSNQAALSYLLLLIVLIASSRFLPDPNHQVIAEALQGPSRLHWMGCDSLGRDLFSRLIVGAQSTLIIALGSTTIALFLGIALGSFSAYRGGRVDQVMMRVVDVWYSIPSILLIILVKEMVERGHSNRTLASLLLALSLYSWMHFARLARGEILRIKSHLYIDSAINLGASHWRIILRHLLPNIMPVLITAALLRLPLAIFSETLLSFVGLGVKSPQSSWGTLAAEGWQAMRFNPHLIVFPSVTLFLTILAFHVLGDFLQSRFHAGGEGLLS